MQMDDASVGKLMRQYREEEEQLRRLRSEIADAGQHLQRLASALQGDLESVLITGSDDALSVGQSGVLMPYTLLQTLAQQIKQFDELTRERREKRNTLIGQGLIDG